MARKPQKSAVRGSQKWLQILVNEKPQQLTKLIVSACALPELSSIRWLSPLVGDDYAEYSDGQALALLGLDLPVMPLSDFWPERGPNWDALGRADKGQVILIEAKAHVPELITSCAAKEPARSKIKAALSDIREFFGVPAQHEQYWMSPFYQYANRLAHLYFLREINNVEAYLAFVHFVGDEEMKGPRTEDEWRGAICLMESLLGLRRHKLTEYIGHIFVNVDILSRIDAVSAEGPRVPAAR